MAAPHEILARLEGLSGIVLGSTEIGTQAVYTWIEMAKTVMHQTYLRGVDDWEFDYAEDVDDDNGGDGLVTASAATVYGLLCSNLDAGAEAPWVVLQNLSTLAAFVASSALDNDVFFVTRLPLAATEGAPEWAGHIFPHGIVFGTGVCINADGEDSTAPATDDIDAFILYRTS